MKNFPKPEKDWTFNESEIYLLAEQGIFNETIDLFSKSYFDFDPKILILKLKCLVRGGKYFEALQVIMELENDGINIPHIHLFKGECLFHLKEYLPAFTSFKKCPPEEITPEVERWIQKCQVHLNPEETIFDFPTEKVNLNEEEENPEPIINYDYFQTNTHVILFIDVVGAKKDKSYAEFHKKSVDIYVDNYDVKLHFPLANEIDPSQSSFTIGPYSIECKLLKVTQGDWEQYEDTSETCEPI